VLGGIAVAPASVPIVVQAHALHSRVRGTEMRHADGQQRNRGQAIVEMAIALTLLLFLFVGTLDFGRIYYTTLGVAHAAREGAQYGAQSNTTSSDIAGMQQAALDAAGDVPGVTATARQYCKCASGTTVDCITDTCPEGAQQVYVEVTVDKVFNTILQYPGIPQTVDVTRQVTIRVQ